MMRVMPPPASRPREVRAWLATDPPLAELREAFPHEWTVVERELGAVLDTGEPAALAEYAQRVAKPGPMSKTAPRSPSGLDARLAAAVRQRMAADAIRSISLRAATGATGSSVRFGKVNGRLAQRLLFRRGLERKPVSMLRFRLTWPLLTQRARLMPLVQPQGIYCFFSGAFVRRLGELIGDRPAVEIAAGDGTLSRFLAARGTQIRATDDHSWAAVTFPDDVEHLDARRALATHEPAVVICSWPPSGNDFERAVFETASVECYIVIGNRQTAGWGDQAAYAAAGQHGFTSRDAPELARLILPPEIEPVVLVFERTSDQPADLAFGVFRRGDAGRRIAREAQWGAWVAGRRSREGAGDDRAVGDATLAVTRRKRGAVGGSAWGGLGDRLVAPSGNDDRDVAAHGLAGAHARNVCGDDEGCAAPRGSRPQRSDELAIEPSEHFADGTLAAWIVWVTPPCDERRR